MSDHRRLAKLRAMSPDELRAELTSLLADETRLAELSAAELEFLAERDAEWRAETARLHEDISQRLAAWTPPVCAETGQTWRH